MRIGYKPGRMSSRTSLKVPKLSSHLVKPAAFKSSRVSLKVPKFTGGKGRGSVKVKI